MELEAASQLVELKSFFLLWPRSGPAKSAGYLARTNERTDGRTRTERFLLRLTSASRWKEEREKGE